MDSSSIVKLFVDEDHSEETRTLRDQADSLASCLIACAEVRAALARARRGRRIPTEPAFERCKASFEVEWQDFYQVEARSELITRAGSLAETHALSGFDSVHLSVALGFQGYVSDEVWFSTWDKALARAASAEGLRLAHEVNA